MFYFLNYVGILGLPQIHCGATSYGTNIVRTNIVEPRFRDLSCSEEYYLEKERSGK